MPRAVPNADAKIGKKMDFIAAELGAALAPLGYIRTARRLWRESGSGEQQCFQVIELQGDKWNEGSHGKFIVNMGVQFPALLRLVGELQDQAWRTELANTPDTAAAAIRGDLGTALPGHPEDWWLPEMEGASGIWFQIGEATDLAALAAVVIKCAGQYVVPWLNRHASFAGLLGTPDTFIKEFASRLVANVLLGRQEEAQGMFMASGVERLDEGSFARIKAWLVARGVDVEAAQWQDVAPSPRALMYAESRTVAEAAELALAQDPAPVSERLPQLLEAFHQACRTREVENDASPIWALLRSSDEATRRRTVLTILELLPAASTEVPSLHPNLYGKYASYDGYWGELVAMLLKDLPSDAAFAAALFDALGPLTARTSDIGINTLSLSPAWCHVVRYLCSQASSWSDSFKPRGATLFEAVREVALADFDRDYHAFRAFAAKQGANPDSVTTDSAMLRSRLVLQPERRFTKPEREVIATLRKWAGNEA